MDIIVKLIIGGLPTTLSYSHYWFIRHEWYPRIDIQFTIYIANSETVFAVITVWTLIFTALINETKTSIRTLIRNRNIVFRASASRYMVCAKSKRGNSPENSRRSSISKQVQHRTLQSVPAGFPNTKTIPRECWITSILSHSNHPTVFECRSIEVAFYRIIL